MDSFHWYSIHKRPTNEQKTPTNEQKRPTDVCLPPGSTGILQEGGGRLAFCSLVGLFCSLVGLFCSHYESTGVLEVGEGA